MAGLALTQKPECLSLRSTSSSSSGWNTYSSIPQPIEVLLPNPELILGNQLLSAIYILAGMNQCVPSPRQINSLSLICHCEKVFLSPMAASKEGKNLRSIRSILRSWNCTIKSVTSLCVPLLLLTLMLLELASQQTILQYSFFLSLNHRAVNIDFSHWILIITSTAGTEGIDIRFISQIKKLGFRKDCEKKGT